MGTESRNTASVLARIVLGIVAIGAGIVLVVVLSVKAAGWVTVEILRALDMLSYESYYTGTWFIAQPALWVLSLVYVVPQILCVLLLSQHFVTGAPQLRTTARRIIDGALSGFAIAAALGVASFSFDASRLSEHEPLVQRCPELSYEAADVVFAATWVMLIMIPVFLVTELSVTSRRKRAALQISAFLALTLIFGALFGQT